MISYKLDGKEVVELADGTATGKYDSLEDFLIHERDLLDRLFFEINESLHEVMPGKEDLKNLKAMIHPFMMDHFEKLFKAGEVKEIDLKKEEKNLESKLESFGEQALKDTKEFLYDALKKQFKQKTANGGDMFKTIKEAKAFTAHLDALANEIEGLTDVSPEMKKHLAYRLDRLSDLIEGTIAKEASLEKEANGVGDGAWIQDDDEPYMKTMGGTGPLKRDKDEPYMDIFKKDQHKQVLEREEPKQIAEGGAKVKQPSDNYNEAQVASKIKSMVKKVLQKNTAK